MTVGFKVGSITDEIGSSDFFHAFFSTIAVRLEPAWGARFPVLMTKLYQGELRQEDAVLALGELATVQSELRAFPPSQIMWDHDDKSKSPPWGTDIAATITDLSNYFVTSTGRDLIETLREGIEALRDQGGVGRVVNY
ncbi:immunity 70 family protein [Brevundimonas sp. AJA228-03]|uniref:immunity 70 family protein n=1 Tax=Brevundimonas sp. AJA228-03 TaxID=2752515 RepID=UPI001AE073EB|nr:immunity 70 family protein [Brevundimonas sp. AJA228-03]QTN20364.1 immunity 70 family protein [Brevundimonas sp. AJA228-03]